MGVTETSKLSDVVELYGEYDDTDASSEYDVLYYWDSITSGDMNFSLSVSFRYSDDLADCVYITVY